ncbi:cdc25-like protein phosphatase twine [Drosophila busckii]|uniref:cdc25-like protein phosphatase twine n=1 Tax=Drosophila busckii TaxID=30019 RepID=UPI001432C175|nr:cdc25-like protein phosphatase twine [Drosophila busckii]
MQMERGHRMAGKRLSLLLDDCAVDQPEQPGSEEGVGELRAPKRYKTHVHNLGCEGSVLSPMTQLSRHMRLLGREDDTEDGTPKSSMRRSFNSVCSSYDSSNSNSLDDEYMAMFELENFDAATVQPQSELPNDLAALISGKLNTETQQQLDTPQRPKSNASTAAKKQLRKAMSMNDAEILHALDGEEPDLIGDLSKPCALPVMLNGLRHRDLKTISCDTLARLMRGEFAELHNRLQIIDCRYPYEYEAGHIRDALNLYTHAQIKEAFPAQDEATKRIYVFHCEFSSERGPKLMRFLRSADRSAHTHDYPTLDYPELYLLHNGYKEFFASFADLCEPRNYVPMLAPAHNEEYRLFRSKTKSWQSGDSDAAAVDSLPPRLRKSRSRLLYTE